MKNGFYKLKDVPKEQRLGHFFRYYMPYVFAAIVGLTIVGYLFYGLLLPDTDAAVLWLSGDYTYACENALRDAIHESGWDVDGNGKVSEMLTYIEFTDEYSNLSLQTMSELNTLVGGQEYSYFLVNDYALTWMTNQEILGTWEDAGIDKEGYLIVNVKDIKSFCGEDMEPLENLYLVITTPDTGKNTETEYARQTKALREFLSKEGLI